MIIMPKDTDKITQLSRILLLNEKKMAREQDLTNLAGTVEELEELIPELTNRFNGLGLSLVRTKFQGERYYVLTAPGKDEKLSPKMYGTLAILIATFNDLGSDLPVQELKPIFNELWDEVEQLKTMNYLMQWINDGIEVLTATPLGKIRFKKNVLTYQFRRKIVSNFIFSK
jgi:hypothetical protein